MKYLSFHPLLTFRTFYLWIYQASVDLQRRKKSLLPAPSARTCARPDTVSVRFAFTNTVSAGFTTSSLRCGVINPVRCWHSSFASGASGRAAPVACKSMRHSLPHSLPLRSLLSRSLRSLRSSGSLRFRSFRRSFSRIDSQSTRCLLLVRHLPVAGRFHI